jgi:hypothetical protein
MRRESFPFGSGAAFTFFVLKIWRQPISQYIYGIGEKSWRSLIIDLTFSLKQGKRPIIDPYTQFKKPSCNDSSVISLKLKATENSNMGVVLFHIPEKKSTLSKVEYFFNDVNIHIFMALH